MEQHHYTAWQWVNHHWAVISLVYFPAFMCYLNSIAIFFKVMGATKLADFLGKLEEALIAARAAAKTYKQQNSTTPTDKSGQTILDFILIIVCLFCVGCALNYHEKTFIQGTNVTSAQYGHFDNATINHEGNLWIGPLNDNYSGSSNNTSK